MSPWHPRTRLHGPKQANAGRVKNQWRRSRPEAIETSGMANPNERDSRGRQCQPQPKRPAAPRDSKGEPIANVSAKARAVPAFDAVARGILGLNDHGLIRVQLLSIWNARGAADIATVESQLFEIMEPADVGPHLKRLDRAIRALDRT